MRKLLAALVGTASLPRCRTTVLTRGILALAIAVLGAVRLAAQDAPAPAPAVVQQGKYVLHKFEQPIGEETWTLARDGDGFVLSSKFKFTDRGSAVPLGATLKLAADLTPRSYVVKGNVSRFSTIDTELSIDGHDA